MPKQKKGAIKKVVEEVQELVDQTPEEVIPPTQAASVATESQGDSAALASEVTAKKSYYNKERAKAYRDRIREAAIAGGYIFKEKGVGGGTTVKKVSKTGKEYYYQPWSLLTKEQKEARLAAARERSIQDRELAQKYKQEHPELFKKEEQSGN